LLLKTLLLPKKLKLLQKMQQLKKLKAQNNYLIKRTERKKTFYLESLRLIS
jgi:hypothetical protein